MDPKLHGAGGPLRVTSGYEPHLFAAASVMPAVPTGNTHAPTRMIGEKAADLLLAWAKFV